MIHELLKVALSLAAILLLVAIATLCLSIPKAHAADPGPLSFQRLSAGPRVTGQVYEFDDGLPREFGFSAGAAASYNLTSRLDASGSADRKFTAGETLPCSWRYAVGGQLLLPNSNEKQQWFLGIERAWYHFDGKTQPGSWVVRLQWAFGIQKEDGHDVAFGLARGRYDPDNGVKDFGAGIQAQALGGK